MDLSDSQSVRALPWLIYSVNVIGLAGNLFSFAVFSRKTFAKSPYRIYFKSLALFDSFVVFNLVIGVASIINKIDLVNQINNICKFVYFVSVATSPNSGWILVFFSIDQLIRVSMSSRLGFVKQRNFQYGAIVCLVLFHILMAVSVIAQVEVKDVTVNNATLKMCQYPPKSVLPIIYLVESCLIPFGIMMLTTGIILKSLYQSRSSLKKYILTRGVAGGSGSGSATGGGGSSSSPATPLTKPVTATVKTSKRSRDLKFAFNSVIFNTLFILLTIPLVIIHLSRSNNGNTNNSTQNQFNSDIEFISTNSTITSTTMTNQQNDLHSGFIRLKAVCFFLFNMNFALHFWIHFCVNSIFRNEVLFMLGCKRTRQHAPVNI